MKNKSHKLILTILLSSFGAFSFCNAANAEPPKRYVLIQGASASNYPLDGPSPDIVAGINIGDMNAGWIKSGVGHRLENLRPCVLFFYSGYPRFSCAYDYCFRPVGYPETCWNVSPGIIVGPVCDTQAAVWDGSGINCPPENCE